ncbi:hypothetical protein [Klebsiella phage pKP-BM327-1.1]|nr:hypothetical protein [Klebsiella phage pKP-BM327-1.1]
MLIELSTLNTPAKRFWETVSKQPPVYSISEAEIKKARVQYSIGIIEPRVNVTKLRIKMNERALIETRVALNKNKLMRLYKDDQGFYLKEIDW